MFGKKKIKPKIDQEQLELIQNAQHRVRQKKRLYFHFVLFVLGAIAMIIANLALGVREDITPFEKPWFVSAILIWLCLLLYHFLNVFVFNTFMGKAWEKAQLDKLIIAQKVRIEKLKNQLEKEDMHIAKSELFNAQNTTNALHQINTTNEQHINTQKNNLTIIVAAGENNEIGKDNKLIWHLSDDLKRFKKLTSGHYIIMGRKTFESFPKPLPNRTHVVITKQVNYSAPEGVIVVNSIEEALKETQNAVQAFVIGGGEIYKQALPFVSKIELTRVHHTFDADTFFPEIDLNLWKETRNEFHKKDKDHAYEFSFLTYQLPKEL